MAIDDETLELMARAHDEEEAAQKGEPSPWRADLCTGPDFPEFRAERLAAMRCAAEALFRTLAP